jgi:hypothetical protein
MSNEDIETLTKAAVKLGPGNYGISIIPLPNERYVANSFPPEHTILVATEGLMISGTTLLECLVKLVNESRSEKLRTLRGRLQELEKMRDDTAKAITDLEKP